MTTLNHEGFIKYYDSATRGRNREFYQSIYECMIQIEQNIKVNNRTTYMNTYNYVTNNFLEYKKVLKTMLMTCGMSKSSVDTLLRHLHDWLQNI